MASNFFSNSCYSISDSIPTPYETGEVSVNFTLNQALSIKMFCSLIVGAEVDLENQHKYSKPMAWIGVYISVASLFCTLAMAADLWNGYRQRKFWFPSKYFSLNAVTITIITIAMKLPMDLNTPMEQLDEVTKVGSLVFVCTMIANLMPSLASIDNKELTANVVGLAILIITIIVNIVMEMSTGVIYHKDKTIVCIYVVMLLFLLLVLISVAISVPIFKQILEQKYQAIIKTSLNDQHSLDGFIVERLREHVIRYGIMVETGSPQFVMASNALCSASGVTCGIGLVIYILLVRDKYPHDLLIFESPYKWSTCVIGITQFIGVLVGSIAPIFRCTTVASYKSFGRWTKKHFVVFKVEKYWTQKLFEWKESHITVLSGSRRSRSVFRNLKILFLSLWIAIQYATVVACKIICLIPTLFILVILCSNYLKYFLKGMLSDMLPSNGNTNEDLNKYVLLLEDNMELAEKTLKQISQSLNRLIQTAEKEQDNNLLKLLEKSTGFEGVSKFVIYQAEPPLHLELPNNWSLAIATLTCIAIALPNSSDIIDNLLKSVAEGLSYTYLVDESLNIACQYVNVKIAARTLWDEVEDKFKWLGHTLEKYYFQGKTAKEILEWFLHKAEEIVNEVYTSCLGEPIEKLPHKLIVANSMKNIAQTIMCTYNISEITKQQLFVLLSHMIADILVACFNNIPRVITMKCHESAIERREASVEAAAKLLGKTTKLIKIITKRELPRMDPDKLAFIDECRPYMQYIP